MWGKRPESSDADRPVPTLGGFDETHRELLADRSIQFELQPVELPSGSPRNPDLSGLIDLAPVLRAVFWILIALAVGFLLYLIISRLTGFSFRRRGTTDEEEQEWTMAEQPARQLLSDADALAARGMFSEAAHLLLFRSIDEIDQRRPDTVRKALTSRDIARLPVLPARPAEAFGGIVRAVERSLFGGRALDAADWQQCRAAYEQFAFEREWQG